MNQQEKRQELTVHLILGALFFASAWYGEELAQGSLWRDPRIGVFTLAVGLVWVVWFFLRRIKELQDRQRILEDRIDRLQNKLEAVEDEQREERML
jgi:hypothetical protein